MNTVQCIVTVCFCLSDIILTNPSHDVTMHYLQISAQAAVLRVKSSGRAHDGGMDAFVEEAVVRRELSDNFCYCEL